MTSYVLTSPELRPPRVAELRDTVRRAVGGDFETTWHRLCGEAGVPAGAVTMTLTQLADLAAAMTNAPGVLGVMGRSHVVRLTTFRTLSALEGSRS